eukprot:s399_g18.t1
MPTQTHVAVAVNFSFLFSLTPVTNTLVSNTCFARAEAVRISSEAVCEMQLLVFMHSYVQAKNLDLQGRARVRFAWDPTWRLHLLWKLQHPQWQVSCLLKSWSIRRMDAVEAAKHADGVSPMTPNKDESDEDTAERAAKRSRLEDEEEKTVDVDAKWIRLYLEGCRGDGAH